MATRTKRRKVVDDREEDKKKAEFSGGGKGGILGQYMQDQRKEGHDQAVANGKVVDISFDDDEVQVVSNPADKEVCYGRIEGAEINAFKVPTPREGAVAISNNTNTALGLVPILDAKFSVRTAARVLTRQRRPNDPPPGSEVSARYGLDVNLYGPKKHAIQIGRHLSQKQLWLRTPLFVESGVELYNPHVIEKPAQIAQRPLMSYSSRQAPVRTTEEIRSDVLGMFDSLEKSESLPEMEPNHRITTELLKHQKQEWAQLQPAAEADNRDLCCSKKGKTALPKIEQAPLSRNCKTTLLVSPLSTIANWEEQIKQHVKPGALKYYIYHGSGRIKDVNKLAQFDLVITTYGSVASEFNNRSKQKHGVYPLEEMNWFRIVLDEAHMIREQSTQQSKAICRLQASRRWAVTGTPVQNKLEDLGALMTFLRVKPFDEKGGFAQYIMAPFKMCDPEILPKLRLLVDSITLRRLKDRIDLPQRRDELVKLDFSPAERHLYDVFAKNASDRVKVIVNQREKSLGGRTYVHILQSILRLRLICAHGEDLLGEEDLEVMKGLNQASAIELDSDDEDDRPALSAKQAYDMYQLMIDTNADLCSTCSRKVGVNDNIEAEEGETKEKIIGFMTPCFHIICPNCFDGFKAQMDHYSEGRTTSDCIICRQHIKLSYFELKPGGLEEGGPKSKGKKQTKTLENYHGPHTKTKALIQDLNNSRMESEILHHEAPIKSVVFSGWTAHLDLIQLALNANNIKYCRLDGKMTRAARGAAMDAFRDDPSILVILVSITAGGLGLNLTSANKVYVMEPQYNPAAEAQAIDRVHRLGQKREVTTVRYIMNDSFEEKMLELQDKKRKLASISMDGEKGRMDKVDAARKRLEDLRSKRTPSSATKAEAKTDKTPTKTDRTVQSKSDKKEASTKKKDSERPSTPPPACEVIDGVEKTPGLVGPIRPQVIGAGSDIKIAPFKGPKGNKVRKSFQEKEDEYGQEILKRPDHAFHELHVCYQKGPKGSPTYDKAGFELDYKEVAKWMAPKAYDKSAMMRAMDRAIESSEKKEEAMKRIFFEPGAAPVEGPESFRDVGFWVDRVSKDLNVPWHRVGVKEFEIWEKKGFRKAKRGEFAYANATMEEKERISRLGEGRYLRKFFDTG
ncbi:putative SWI/SNF-related matrix-associated actin-dependent regulator of chromatin subfamily A member 3-like 1 [Glarea lozoyensis 74030]|uniref:Putative SWI/SNF-related matrix-associated actin-dependent regulator of chromatin subfamily A member 3-like 1 n=1 Tax=Glarea lozoyensis (strain ATCC 74030 / MF5533) TaxID=1104152 RepID=H0EY39_GLAL7|nr:putative SWI/SNF-related matrix-associated actin-dependent regulator of chromatin subfamily A member 3-like 1 [Glarea lozoyensis 74030]